MAGEAEKVIVGAVESSPGVWRITHNGRVLGDSRGFGAREVRAKIDNQVAELRGYRFPYDATASYPKMSA